MEGFTTPSIFSELCATFFIHCVITFATLRIKVQSRLESYETKSVAFLGDGTHQLAEIGAITGDTISYCDRNTSCRIFH